MPVEFDPYHKWLGIPRSEQPAHHYRLLGIPVFEDDPQVIEGAADRQMAFLRKFQTGEHAATAMKLLNEVSRARLCLLKAHTKSMYDESLRSILEPEKKVPVWQQPLVLGAAGLTVIAVVALAFVFGPSSKPAAVADNSAAKSNSPPAPPTADNAVASAETDTSQIKSKSTLKQPSTTKSSKAEKQPDGLQASGNKAPWPTLLDTESHANSNAKAQVEQPLKIPQDNSNEFINLVTRVDFARDTATGEWRADESGLIGQVSHRNAIGRLNVPYRPTPEYDLHITVERQMPIGAFVIGLPIQDRQCALVLDTGRDNDRSGLSLIDGKLAHQNETTHRGRILRGGEPVQFVCRVRRNAVTVLRDGVLFINWQGDNNLLTPPEGLPFIDPQSLMLALQGGTFRVAELKLKAMESEAPTTTAAPPTLATTNTNRLKATAPEGALQITKLPTPAESELETARKKVKELYSIEYGLAKKAEGRNLEPRISLAKTLYAKGQDSEDDPAASFVMLSEAAEFAAEAGQLVLAWDALQALGERFQMTPLPLMERAAKAAKPFAKSFDDVTALSAMYVLLLETAQQSDDFQTSGKILQEASSVARKIPVLKEQLAAHGRRSNILREAFDIAQPARDALQANIENGAASLVWGRYLCFHKRDWATGLPVLAKSDNAELAAVAKSDLAQPRDPAALIKLGDAWWELADQEREPVKGSIRERALDAWQLALQVADQSDRQLLETKIARLFEPTKSYATSGSGQGVAVASDDLNPGIFFTVEFWVSTTSPRGVLISKRHQSRESSIAIRLDRGCPVIGGDSGDGFHSAKSQVVISDGRFHHIAAVKIAKRLVLFVDGKSVAQVNALDAYTSGSPWKVGHADVWEINEPDAKFCRLRFSKEARYLVNFLPEKTYTKDKGTLFVP